MNPFPGPQPYRAADRDRFYGRDRMIDELSEAVVSHRVLTVYGPSGAGKSSLMQAGVIPMVAEEWDLRTVVVDSWPPEQVQRGGPVVQLVEGITTQLGISGVGDEDLDEALSMAFRRSDRPVLLFLDQLEQLLVHHEREVLVQFVEVLTRLENFRGVGLHVVLTLREDYLGRWSNLLGGHPRLLRQSFRVPRMSVDEVTTAVVEAAASGGQTWDPLALEPLLEEMVLPGQWKADQSDVECAYVQIVCRALFDRGGIAVEHGLSATALLEQYLEDALAGLGPLESQARQILEDLLITRSGKRQPMARSAALEKLPSAQDADTILQALEDARILHARQRHGERIYEIGHDRLTGPIRDSARRRREANARARLVRRWAVAAVLVFLSLAGLAVWQSYRAITAENRAFADANEQITTERDRARDLTLVAEARDNGDPTFAAALLLDVGESNRNQAWRETAHATLGKPIARYVGETPGKPFVWDEESGQLRTLELPEGLQLEAEDEVVFGPEAAAAPLVVVHDAGGAEVWHLAEKPTHCTLSLAGGTSGSGEDDGHINSASFSADGRWIGTAGLDRRARIWRTADCTLVAEQPRVFWAGQNRVAFSPDSAHLAVADDSKFVRVWTWDPPEEGPDAKRTLQDLRGPLDLTCHDFGVFSARFSPDGSRIVSAGGDGNACLWEKPPSGWTHENTRKWERSAVMSEHLAAVHTAEFSPDGRYIVTASFDFTARVLHGSTGDPLGILSGHRDEVISARFSHPDGKAIVTVSQDGTTRVWETASLFEQFEIPASKDSISAIAYGPDGRRFATGGRDRVARIWEERNPRPQRATDRHGAAVATVAWAPDGRWMLTTSRETAAHLWRVADEPNESSCPFGAGDHVRFAEGPGTTIYSAAFHPSGGWIATAHRDRTVRLWKFNLETCDVSAEPVLTLTGYESAVRSVAFSPDRLYIAAGANDGTIRIHDLSTAGETLETDGAPRVLEGHTTTVRALAFSPDSSRLATASLDGTASVWSLTNLGAKSWPLGGHEKGVTSVAFSADSRLVATGSLDQRVRVWELAETGRPGQTLELCGHRGGVWGVAFRPEEGSRQLASVSEDGTIRLQTVVMAQCELLGRLSDATTYRLDEKSRNRILGEDEEDARVAVESCEPLETASERAP